MFSQSLINKQKKLFSDSQKYNVFVWKMPKISILFTKKTQINKAT